ncbi:MAG TPA: NAD(P)H-binding protein [Terriglobales bacterium]
MYAILGANGHTGRIVAKTLLARGQEVRVVGRNPEHLERFTAHGAQAAAADATDAAALSQAFQGADSVYVLLPPDPTSSDYRGYQARVTDAIVAAIKHAGVKNAVVLSSIGADKPSGTGPVLGLFNLEQKLNQVPDLNALYLRAGYFMENTLPQAAVVRHAGAMIGPLRGDLKVSMIASRDIGQAAADALLRLDFHGKQVRELQGHRDLDYNQAAEIIGKAIAQPTLKYVHASDDQIRPALVQMGMSENMVGLLLEMTAAMNSGHMKALEARTTANTTPTSFEAFVNEQFVAAYQQQQKAA